MSLADALRRHIDARLRAGLCLLCDEPSGSCANCRRIYEKIAAQYDEAFGARPDISAVTRDVARGA